MKKRHKISRTTLSAVVALGIVLSAAPALAIQSTPDRSSASASVLGLQATAFSATELSKWQSMYGRHKSQTRSGSDGQWNNALSQLKKVPSARLLSETNRIVNRARGRPDRGGDNWSTPTELFTKGGDCEDYAIAKYLLLRQVGFSSSNMHILVLKGTSKQQAHAVLVVGNGSNAVVLDNQRGSVYSMNSAIRSRVFIVFNERNLWLPMHNVLEAGR